jgi:death on curing protein
MSRRIAFLTVEQVLAIHRRVCEEFGGDASLRDRGLLESAVSMPAATFGGEFLHAGLPAMAGAYLFQLCRNHPFVDGNKRTALVAAEVFLQLNRPRLLASDAELEQLTIGVAAGSLSKAGTIEFFVEHTSGSAG